MLINQQKLLRVKHRLEFIRTIDETDYYNYVRLMPNGQIRKANLTQGISYFFYDTFKNDLSTTGDWAAMKVTATKLTELAKQLDMFGYLSIQLTDDANFIKPDELTSSNIANCKSIKHVLHTLFLFKEIPKNRG